MLKSLVKTFNGAFDSTAGKLPIVGKTLKSLTPKEQSGGRKQNGGACPCSTTNKVGGYKYSKKASLARSKRARARSLKRTKKSSSKSRTKSKRKGRGRKSRR